MRMGKDREMAALHWHDTKGVLPVTIVDLVQMYVVHVERTSKG